MAGNDGFTLTYEHPVAAPAADALPVVRVTVRLIWPEGATEKEVGTALTTATAHALEQYGKRVSS